MFYLQIKNTLKEMLVHGDSLSKCVHADLANVSLRAILNFFEQSAQQGNQSALSLQAKNILAYLSKNESPLATLDLFNELQSDQRGTMSQITAILHQMKLGLLTCQHHINRNLKTVESFYKKMHEKKKAKVIKYVLDRAKIPVCISVIGKLSQGNNITEAAIDVCRQTQCRHNEWTMSKCTQRLCLST